MVTAEKSIARRLLLPGVPFLLFWALAILTWSSSGSIGFLVNFGYLGTVLGGGLGLYTFLPRKRKPVARKLTQFLIGLYLLVLPAFWYVNMQIEGFFFLLLAGVAGGALQHYMIAKVFGPLLFGRLYCGWGCWTAMMLDLLPYGGHARGWRKGHWRHLRVVHLGLSVIVVCAAYVVFGYRGFAGTGSAYSPEASEVLWIVAGNLLYYSLGIALGIVLNDNRAFCKYACPISVIMKTTSRFSLLKIEGDSASCRECRACTRVCPMSIDIPAYVKSGRRILSTECTLCQTCTTVCPKQTLHVSLGFDAGRQDYLLEEYTFTSTRSS